MADKKYRMTVTLTDGTKFGAGIITAPQGPAGPAGADGSDAVSWEEVTFSDASPTATIETSSGVKQIKIRVSGEDIPSESDDCVVLSEEVVIFLSPDGTMSDDTMKVLILSPYNGAGSMRFAHGFEYFTNAVVTYDIETTVYNTEEFTGREFILKDLSRGTYSEGLSIANLPDGAAVQAMYAVRALKKAAAS